MQFRNNTFEIKIAEFLLEKNYKFQLFSETPTLAESFQIFFGQKVDYGHVQIIMKKNFGYHKRFKKYLREVKFSAKDNQKNQKYKAILCQKETKRDFLLRWET